MRPHHAATFTRAEAEVLRLWDLGYTKQRIVHETAINVAVVSRTIAWCSESETRAHLRDMRAGSAKLLAAMNRAGLAA